MKKVLFVIGSLDNGGAERVIALLSNELQDMGYQVSIVTIIDNRIAYELNENVHVTPLQLNGSSIKRNLERIKKLRKEIKKNDVIISFLATVNMATLVASLGLHKQIILSERNDPAKEPGSSMGRAIRDMMYAFTRQCKFVFQTEDAAKYFKKSVRKQATIIPNPLSNLPEPHQGTRKHNIVTIARLEPQKNLKMLMKCFSNVNMIHEDYVLDIYGRGPLKGELEEYARDLKIKDKIQFHGFVSDIHNEIKDAGLYVMSSDYEGISNGMLEALGLGLPVIATDCPIGGARMFIRNNKNGILVPVRDEVEMTKSILRVIENQDFAEMIGNAAIDIRGQLSLEAIAKLWSEVIEGYK